MKHNKWIAFLLALTLLLNVCPVFAAATEPQTEMQDEVSNNNQTSEPPEQWIYIPSEIAPTLNSDGESSADLVQVHVTATDRTTGETVDVPGATVNLYVGSELKDSVIDDDNDGLVELSLAGLSYVERQNATISANKIVSRGMAVDGDNREKLYKSYPEHNGEPYRYTIELHSETIDPNGNWLGEPIPEGTESNKVDIVFVIDATGSMSNEINNVRTNIASFSENLLESGLDIRFCIIDYRDITEGEPTHVHTLSGSHWMNDIDSVVDSLASIDATGGGDTPETVMDPLGYVADNGLMSWRSDAYKFAFVLTDANYKTSNNYGYSSMSQLVDQLAAMKVVTSVITSTSYSDTYSELYETTGGIWANINSSTFDAEMLALSDSIIESVTREMTLTLSEPRMLVNLSVCFYADDSVSLSSEYREDVRNMLNQYAHRMAEATDGHVLIDKIILYQTSNRINFYKTSQLPSMADIRIETDEAETIRIHSNAYSNGFYTDDTVKSDIKEYFPEFNNIPDFLSNRSNYVRIQMSGVEGAGWNNSMIDQVYDYSTTVMHETGHYLFGFFDEYMDASGTSWRVAGNRPYSGFGLMDNQHSDIELSKNGIDYAYITSNNAPTYHWNVYRQSCEDTLADLLTTGTTNYDSSRNTANYYCYDLPADGIFDDTGEDAEYDQYRISYSKAGTADRKATYSYAELSASDFLTLSSSRSSAETLASDSSAAFEAEFTRDSVADVTFTANDETVTITVSGDATAEIMLPGDEAFTGVTLTGGTAQLPIPKGELAEIRVTSADGTAYNTYYIDRSEETDAGYLYTSADNAVMAYVTTDELSSYTFVADNTGYENGEYRSMNQATRITSDNGAGFDSGEIYSVANYMAEIDYTTLSWFKFADGEWTALATDLSEEENRNIGARADLDGEGLYVLMAKAAPIGGILPAENLAYTQSEDRDAVVTLTFDDPNENSKYYNVYYSETYFSSKDADGVVVRSFSADSTSLTLNLLERGRRVYAAVEIVSEDGRRSELSEILLIGGEADSDGDGIPDWYCDKYHLWGEPGEDKDIAGSDDDGDGLTNLEEYLGGSDPTDPNDPVHTTNIPVESITVSKTELTLNIGQSVHVSAAVHPDNATNQNISWHTDSTDILSLSPEEAGCTITALAPGSATVYAVSADGGYSASIAVTVLDQPENSFGESITWSLDEEGVLTLTGTGPMPDYDESARIPWKHLRNQIRRVVIGEGITHVGQFAFYQCTSLTDVSIPDSVTSIGAHGFYGCTAMTGLVLPDGLTAIHSAAFEKCTALTEISIPGTVSQIGPYAFRGCTGLRLLDIGSGVEVIGIHAFRDCSGLAGIVLPESIRKVGSHAFRDCTALRSIVFEGSAPSLGINVFANVTANASYPADDPTWTGDVLQNYGGAITWNGVGGAAVVTSGYCGETTWVLKDNGVLTFTGTGIMKNYTAKDAMPWYDYRDQITAVVIEPGITSISAFSFYGMGLTSISIPETVTIIGDYAFKGAEKLVSVELPGNLSNLGESAFYGCTSLGSVDIPASLYTIKPYTFKNCSALTSVTFHEGNLQKISDGAFYGTALTEVILPDCLDILDSYVFKNCASLTHIELSASLTQIREASLYGTAISSIEIPEGVTVIKPYAFKSCGQLVSVQLPETLTAVENSAFYACTALASVVLPDSVTEIGDYAFRRCTGLERITLGSGVTTIGEGAFHTCTALESMDFPAGLTHIGSYCFSGSSGIGTLTFTGNAPAIGTSAFKNLAATAYYPAGNTTWDSVITDNYGGTITWQAK